VLLPEGASLASIEIAPPCLNPVEPVGGWRTEATTTVRDVAVTLLKAVDLNTEIPDVYSGLAMAYSNKGDRQGASRWVAEFRKRATGFKGIESDAPSPASPPAYLKYYYDRFLPEWKKAGLP